MNLVWIALYLAALAACYRLLALSMRSCPVLTPLPLLVLAGMPQLWQRATPLDLGVPTGALILWTFALSLRWKKTPAYFLAGWILVGVPGGIWFAGPILLHLFLSSQGGPTQKVRGLALLLLAAMLWIFSPMRNVSSLSGLQQFSQFFHITCLTAGKETGWQESLRSLLLIAKDLRWIPWYLLALLGALIGGRRSLYPAILLGFLFFGPPGRAALGTRAVAGMGLLFYLSGRSLAALQLPRSVLAMFLACAATYSLAAGWRMSSGRDRDEPVWIVRDLLREADRRSEIVIHRTTVDLLLAAERACSRIRDDLVLIGPIHRDDPSATSSAVARFEEAMIEVADRCQGISPIRGLLFRHAKTPGAPVLHSSFEAFRSSWLERSERISFHLHPAAGDILSESLLFVSEHLWRADQVLPALDELAWATSLAPRSSRVRLMYAQALSNIGRDMDAFRQRHLAYQYSPHDPEALRRYALHLSRIRAHHQAIPLLRKTRQTFPKDSTVITALGNSLVARGLPLEALELYREALRADSNNPYIHYNLGLLLFDREQYEDAAVHASQAVKLGFNRERSNYLMARVYAQLGKDAEALEYLERAVKLDPTGQIALAARKEETFHKLRMYDLFEEITSWRPPPFSESPTALSP